MEEETYCVIEPPPRDPTPEEWEEIDKFFISMGIPPHRNVRVGQGV